MEYEMLTNTWETFYPPAFVKWVKKTLDEVERSKQESRPPSISEFWIQVAKKAKSQTDFELEDPYPNHDVKTSTLIDFSSFQIHKKQFSSLCVYGHIKLTTDYGKEFFLFKREIHDPVDVRFDVNNPTSFTLPEFRLCNLHWLPKFFLLELYLVDKNRTVVLVHKEFQLDFRSKVVYDVEQKISYDAGRFGIFTMSYTVYRSASIAFLNYDIFKPEDKFKPHGIDVCVSGTISAVEGQQQLSYKSHEFDSAILSTNKINSLPDLAVPVYSHLKVRVDLVVDGQPILCDGDDLIFKPARTLAPLKVDIVRGNWCISINVFWIHAFELFPNDVFVGEVIRYLNSDATPESEEDNAQTCIVSNRPIHAARYLGEVFSVSIGSYHQCELANLHIYGTIKLKLNEQPALHIFEKHRMEIEVRKPHQLLSLVNPERCLEGLENGFSMHFDLNDAGACGDDVFCKGRVVWTPGDTFKWHDRRMCSVILGELGYAYVHYAIFDTAIQAKVSVRFPLPCSSTFEVFGKIYARYSTYRYSTHYEKKYFRSMLFNVVDADTPYETLLSNDGTSYLPLSKDVVAVPCDASLILKVKLHCLCSGRGDTIIKGELTLNPTKSDMSCIKRIVGQNDHLLEVEVKWS